MQIYRFGTVSEGGAQAPGRFFDGHIFDGHIIDGHIIDGTYFRRDIFSTSNKVDTFLTNK